MKAKMLDSFILTILTCWTSIAQDGSSQRLVEHHPWVVMDTALYWLVQELLFLVAKVLKLQCLETCMLLIQLQ